MSALSTTTPFEQTYSEHMDEARARANSASVQAQIAYENLKAHPNDLDAMAWADAMRDIANDVSSEETENIRMFVGVLVPGASPIQG